MSGSPLLSTCSNTRFWYRFVITGFCLLALQAFNLHIVRHPELSAQSDRIISRKWFLQAERGALRDRTGALLAYSAPAGSVFADPELVTDAHGEAAAMGGRLKLPVHQLERLLSKRTRYVRSSNNIIISRPIRFVWLKRSLDEMALEQVRKLQLPGIGIQPEPKRFFPHGSLAAHTLGFVNRDHHGASGLERSLDRFLSGTDGLIFAEVDAGKRLIPGRRLYERRAVRGHDVILTLDPAIQQAAEAVLADALRRRNAERGCVIAADPASGEILALATLPSPAHHARYDAKDWTHPAVSYAYEPGSTFKLVTACAAIEEKAVRPGEKVVRCTGSTAIGNHIVHCAVHGKGGHGSLDLEGIIIHSCNIGIGKVAERIPSYRLGRYINLLGFGTKTGIELPGEARGWFPNPSSWTRIEKATIPFGQSVTVTPLQLLAAYCAVANGGILPRLHLVRRVVASADGPGKDIRPRGKRVMSAATAATLRKMLEGVVVRGTGKAAAIPGYRIAGKTGTAQKPTKEAGFKSGKYVGSFVGFLPADKPRIAILVSIDEPKGVHYGAVVAAPVFRAVASRAAAHLGIAPVVQAQSGSSGAAKNQNVRAGSLHPNAASRRKNT